ncbi:hypothetical protein [Actinopolyspora alba]
MACAAAVCALAFPDCPTHPPYPLG